MTDVFLYSGQANPKDVKLTDPTALAGGGIPAIVGNGLVSYSVTGADAVARLIFKGPSTALYAVTNTTAAGKEVFRGTGAAAYAVTGAASAAREIFGDEWGGVDYPGGDGHASYAVTQSQGQGLQTMSGGGSIPLDVTGVMGTGKERFRTQSSFEFVFFPATNPSGTGIVTADIIGNGGAIYGVTRASGTGTIPAPAIDKSAGDWRTYTRNARAELKGLSAMVRIGRPRIQGAGQATAPRLVAQLQLARVSAGAFSESFVVRSLTLVSSLRATGGQANAVMRVTPVSVVRTAITGVASRADAGLRLVPLRARARLGQTNVEIGPDLVELEDEEILFLLDVA